ncbi:hypothetical protein V7166_11240 [Bacillus thuringiensis]
MNTEKQLFQQQHTKWKIILIILFLFLFLVALGVLSFYLMESGDSSPETTI